MDKEQELKYLKEWGFEKRADCEKYIEEKVKEIDTDAVRLFRQFDGRVEEWIKDFLENKRERFVAEVVRGKPLKSTGRILDKMLYSCEEYERWIKILETDQEKEKLKRPNPENFLLTITDVVRFRILCNYLSDVHHFDKKLSGLPYEFEKIKFEKRDNYIQTPYHERRVGHRSVQYVFKYLDDLNPFLFEVQLMTQLQNAWDKKDHHLIYEYVRIGRAEKIPLHMKNRMAAMSEVLYVADTVFDTLKKEIIDIIGEE